MTEAPDRRPGNNHDHSWAEDISEVRACCPDYNPDLAGTGIRCPGAPVEVTAFTVDGEIFSMQSEPRLGPNEQCLCCRPLGHVFCFGVHVPSVAVPAINGDKAPGSVNDWIHRVLYQDWRRAEGRKVRVTLEILPEETATPEGPCDLCGEHRPAGLLKRVCIGGEWIWTCTDKEETRG